MDTFTWLFIIVIVAVIVIAVVVGVKKQQKLMANGSIIKRKPNFWNEKEYFKSYIADQNAFFQALSAAVQNARVCSFSGNYGSVINYKGSSWAAQLVRLQSNDGSIMFSYAVTSYETRKGMTKGVLDFNILLTAIEKTFLQFDPNTQVTTEPINFKSHTSLF